MRYTKEEILDMLEEEDIEFVRLQYCDVMGTLKNFAIRAAHLEEALEYGWVFEGSKLNPDGSFSTEKMRLVPDLDTFEIFPFRPQQGKVARLICDIKTYKNGEAHPQDSRAILKKQLERAEKMGYRFLVAPECEFFLFNCDNEGLATTETFDHGSNYDIGPRDQGENVRRDIILNLDDMGFDILSSYHEYSPGQHEIDFKQSDALVNADRFLTFKMTVKTVAKRHGYHATFMPKPLADATGSGMHLHMTLTDLNGNNCFYDAADEKHMSKTAYHFMAGIMHHIKGISAITNPIVNSYKRLISESDAPSMITWSGDCYDSLIQYSESRKGEMNIELRSPDGTTNPYLAFAVCLAAGLDGIEKEMAAPEECTVPVAQMSADEIATKGIQRLPIMLYESIVELEKDATLRAVIGDAIFEPYAKEKIKEHEDYMRQITQWELEKYLQIF